jgi:hypothetical protein
MEQKLEPFEFNRVLENLTTTFLNINPKMKLMLILEEGPTHTRII